ncbi:hypothetical protein L873DRAFT_1790275 [Choiromyces venosus 120613-1]|uniref:Uncharacterized protein n=1 Tax=Choiromyces venosus 120613-1 TaxID=1336337 RepID=A0A3N4JJS6_9PEZI|nr:hypothetical protein L873DRAFT_1790275 [Choiromyces venosus 120613-1]
MSTTLVNNAGARESKPGGYSSGVPAASRRIPKIRGACATGGGAILVVRAHHSTGFYLSKVLWDKEAEIGCWGPVRKYQIMNGEYLYHQSGHEKVRVPEGRSVVSVPEECKKEWKAIGIVFMSVLGGVDKDGMDSGLERLLKPQTVVPAICQSKKECGSGCWCPKKGEW